MAKSSNPAKDIPAPVEIQEPESARRDCGDCQRFYPPLPRWSVSVPGGEVREIAAATIQDAIRAFNDAGNPQGRVFTRKQLTITEIK